MRKLALGLCLAASAALQAQDPAKDVFEVATVKLNKSGDLRQSIQRQPGGRVTVTNMPVRQLIVFAYQLAQFQLVGGPSWMASDRFDMVAKLQGDPAFGPPGSGPDPIMRAM